MSRDEPRYDRKAIQVDRGELEELNKHLDRDWEVDQMCPFVGHGGGDYVTMDGSILIILKRRHYR